MSVKSKSVQLVQSIYLLVLLMQGQAPGTHADLLVDEVTDGSCLSLSTIFPLLYNKVNLVPIMTEGDYYIPMASKALYRQYAEGLLGRPAVDQKELESMQLVLRCGPLFATIVNTGFPYMKDPPFFGQTCVSAGLPSFMNLGVLSGSLNMEYVQAICTGLPATRPDGSMALHASPSFVATMDSIMWVNDKGTVFLTYRCPADGLKDFKVVSKTKTLSQDDVSIIKEKVAELGFKPQNIAFMKYVEEQPRPKPV